MPDKVYEISADGDHVLLDQPAGSAAEALEAGRKAFPQFAHRMRVAILKQKPKLTTKPKTK